MSVQSTATCLKVWPVVRKAAIQAWILFKAV